MPDFNKQELVLGCVADNHPRYLNQALRLLRSVRWFADQSAGCDFILCVVDACDSEYVREFEELGAKIRIVPKYNASVPVTNKLRFWQLPEILDYDRALCLDCNTIVVRDPAPLLRGPGLEARIAGLPTVPHEVFVELFRTFKLNPPSPTYACALNDEPTIAYFNTGVVAMDRRAITDLAVRWMSFSDALIRLELMTDRKWFIERAALSLALAETGCPFQLLGNEMNFPFGKNRYSLLQDVDPRIIHYHRQVEESGRIRLSDYPLVDARIKAFNAMLSRTSRRRKSTVKGSFRFGLRKLMQSLTSSNSMH